VRTSSHTRHRMVLLALAGLVAAPLTATPFAPPALAAPAAGSWQQPRLDPPIVGEPLAAKPRPPDPGTAAAAKAAARPAPRWPAASSTVLALGRAGTAAAGPARVSEASAPMSVRVRTYDRSTATAAGVDGLLLSLSGVDSSAAGVAAGATARVAVDYGDWKDAYGADWSTRLRLAQLPACALSTPDKPGCATPTPLRTANDTVARQVSAIVPVPAAGAAGPLLAVLSGPASGDGDYAATPLSQSASWTAGGNSGTFAWSYPVRTPPTSGPQPAVTVAYSSQTVDARMAASNNQPSWLGEGFDYAPGFIERRYRPCANDMGSAGHNNTTATGDLCWETDNATLSMPGRGGELLADGADPSRWHLRADDGSLVRRHTGLGNGDNDGEWWVLTDDTGTQFWFGGAAGTNSTWTVPVYGNDPGEPCRKATFAASSCVQAWRWNLDHVVDRHGNTLSYSYTKETNSYGRNGSSTDVVGYDRGGYPASISYGTHDGVGGAPPAQVLFGVADRCLADCADPAHWPDTPLDQQCAAAPCAHTSPTFWTGKRLSTVTTQVAGPGGTPREVERWTFTHEFRDPGDATRAGLWLARIGHTGLVGGALSTPDVVFTGTQLQNRVDIDLADGLLPMNWWRISRIDTGSGGAITVRYAEPDCVPGGSMPDPAHLENNALRCYPVRWTPPGRPAPVLDFFHAYVVTEVREGDLTGGAPDVVHSYDYPTAPAWHYTDDDGLVEPADRTWSVWRGYAAVRERTGDPTRTAQSRVDTEFYRGMDGDHLPTSTRTVEVPAVDVNADGDTGDAGVDAPAGPDADAYAGLVRASRTYDGTAGPEISSTVNEPWQSAPTASRTIAGSTVHSRLTGIAVTHQRAALDTDGGTRPASVRTSSIATTFDDLGFPVAVDDRGDDAVTDDQRCTLTDQLRRTDPATDTWLTGYPARTRDFGVDCATAVAPGLPTGAVLGETRTSYDAQPYGTAPTRGDATAVQELTDAATGVFRSTGRSAYDSYGRVTDSWDALEHRTGTAYTPATGGPVTATVTTNPLGWTSTTTTEPAWGLPVSTVDVNGKRTDVGHDPLGRTTAVWKPGQSKALEQGPTVSYAYLLRADGAAAITTSTLVAGETPSTNGSKVDVALFDGLLRPRQTQQPDASVTGDRIVTDTLYDSAGRAVKQTTPYPMTGAPATEVYVPKPPAYSGPEMLPGWTVTEYDAAGRASAAVFYRRNVEQWRTTTAYTGDRTDVTPPTGGTPTADVTDARGRKIEQRHYRGATAAGAYDATRFRYDARDRLTGVTDPAGNHWNYGYDLAGNQTSSVDPDRGGSTSGYDADGRLVTSTDARGQTLAFDYDVLDRRTGERSGSGTGPLLAQWSYDTVAKGQLTKSTRNGPNGAYSYEVLSYSQRYRPGGTRWTLPAGETGFGAQVFNYLNTYRADGSPDSTRLPAAGGLPLETLQTGYDGVGQPKTLSGAIGNTLVTDTAYTNYGEPAIVTLRNNSGAITQLGLYPDEGTHRLGKILTTHAGTTTTYNDTRISYDAAGNVTKSDEVASGDHQCYRYDRLRRLTDAWTPSSNDCAAAPSVAGLGGPAPYWQSWSHDSAGSRRTAVTHGPTSTTATYTYPAAGDPRPHSPTRIAYTGGVTRTDDYGYNAIGATAAGPAGAGPADRTMAWDAEGRLGSVTDPAGSTSYRYDADGNRLIRTDPAGKTLYLPGQEIRFDTASGTTTATRRYTWQDRTVALRTAAGLTWLAGDQHDATNLAVTADTTPAVASRRTRPYGDSRGTTAGWPSAVDSGVAGGTVDNTGLTHLGARDYDQGTGRFVSVDPLQDLSDPQQWNGYSYADNNPATLSDPSGMRPCNDGDDCVRMNTYVAYGVEQPSIQPTGGAKKPGKPAKSGKAGQSGGARKPGRSGGTSRQPGQPLGSGWNGTMAAVPQAGAGTADEPAPQGVLGVCFGGGLQLWWVAAFDWCLVGDENGVSFISSDITPAGGSGPGAGFGFAGSVVYSPNARNKDDLGGPFDYRASSTPVGNVNIQNGSAADGHPVDVYQGGSGPSVGVGFSSGTSNTDTSSGYIFQWPDWLKTWPWETGTSSVSARITHK
jgi:RHS repeat-associated protein